MRFGDTLPGPRYRVPMNVLTRCLHQPQRVWLRRALFQIHLWTGLALGLYVVVLSITGSALVYRAELDRFLASPRAVLDERATPMTADQLRAAAERVFTRAGRSKRSMKAATAPFRRTWRQRSRWLGRRRRAGRSSTTPTGSDRDDRPRARRRRSRNVSSIRTPVPTRRRHDAGTVVSLVGDPPPRRSADRSARRPLVERIAQSGLHALGDHRRRRVVARCRRAGSGVWA